MHGMVNECLRPPPLLMAESAIYFHQAGISEIAKGYELTQFLAQYIASF